MNKEFNDSEKNFFDKFRKQANTFYNEHPNAVVGFAEMAIGSSLIAWGVSNGVIDMGSQLVATAFGGFNDYSVVGGAVGSVMGGVAGNILGSIGVAACGTAIGVPAAIVIGGGSVILGLCGYTVGDVSQHLLNPSISGGMLAKNVSLLAIGVALLIDGARRCIKDKLILNSLSSFNSYVLQLKKVITSVIAKSSEELKRVKEDLLKAPEDSVDLIGSAVFTSLGIKAGTVIGASVAKASVTWAGSAFLGSVGLKLGLLSAPLWPALSIGGLLSITGYILWKLCRRIVIKIKPTT